MWRKASIVLCFLIALVVSGPLFAETEPRAESAREIFPRIAERIEALVRVKFVLNVKMEGANSDREFDGEVHCLMIDAEGMVLCSNTELGGYVSLMGRMMGSEGFNISAAPKNLEVFFGASNEGIEGELLARDTDRDLAWVRVEMPAESRPAFLDLGESAELAVGETFFIARPMDQFFGRAPVVSSGVVGAIVSRPRKLYVPTMPSNGGFGLPAFNAAGEFVGVTVLQMPGADDQTSGGLFNSPMGFLGQTTKLQDMVGGLILPAAELVKATALARESFAADEMDQVEEPQVD